MLLMETPSLIQTAIRKQTKNDAGCAFPCGKVEGLFHLKKKSQLI